MTVDQSIRRWVSAAKNITDFDISPEGKRAVFGARGDVFTVPAKEGVRRGQPALVHASVADESRRLTSAFEGLVLGHGADAGVTVGPLIERSAVERVAEVVAQATDGGARVRTGGGTPRRDGYFFQLTVLTKVSPDARVVTEETFGPVAPVVTFGDEDEALRLANGTPFGLVAYAYTRDVGRAMRLAEELEAGMVGINRGMVSDASAPFGGVKMSGLGREGGELGLEEYLDPVYVAL